MLQEIVDQIRQHPRLIIAEDFEICAQRMVGHSRQFHNGEENQRQSGEDLWLGSLRILHRKRPGRSFTSSRSAHALQTLVEDAFASAEAASVDPWFRFPLWKLPKEVATKPAPPDLNLPESLYGRLTAAPDSFDEKYDVASVQTWLHRKTERFHLQHQRQIHSLHYSVLNHAADHFFWLKEERSWGLPLGRERERWLSSLLNYSQALREAKPFSQTGTMPMIWAPRAVTSLLRRMAPWFYADQVLRGLSPLESLKGQKIFSGALTLVDDGQLSGSSQAMPFDLEGSLTQQTSLVEVGVLQDFLYDAYCATRENRLSTGSFLRQTEGREPRVSANTLYFRPSTEPRDSLLRWMNEGVVLESLDAVEPVPESETEWIVKGAGWRVSGGELAEAIQGLSFKVDLLTVWRQAAAIGNDMEFFGCYGAPSILFEDIPLGI